MVLESALLHVRPGQEAAFEAAFDEARHIIGAMPGFLSLSLSRCVEKTSDYLLLVRWRTLEDHTIGFRQSESYQRCRALLHHFYDPMPDVLHHTPVLEHA
ncbi:antibiotic biosynthesis monooxygenase family protein [Ralstonia solanacearum]|uniref:antibiotic biosynthesis monooxygenase family protein n=1 Tax=Ralstonia solanacearum TaxID=305 RepID=UPI0018D05256|nr:antibiotic biosynthesis monooxygenase [Ralstonia solanacearum]